MNTMIGNHEQYDLSPRSENGLAETPLMQHGRLPVTLHDVDCILSYWIRREENFLKGAT